MNIGGQAKVACLFVSGLLCLSQAAQAAPLTFQFTGAVTQINTDPADPFAGGIAFGTLVSGSYTFDDSTVDGAADPDTGSYNSIGAPFTLTMNIGGFPFLADALVNIGVANNFAGPVDQYSVFATGANSLQLSILFQDFSASVFSNDALPLVPPDVSSFLTRTFQLTADVNGNQVQIDGTIDTLTAVQVPEPSTAWIVAAGLAALMLIRRRRIKMKFPSAHSLALLIVFGCNLWAVDGVVLIDQARVLAGNITPGDTPGFPATISLRGSYRLSGNLTVPDASTDGIVATAADVTIDLNGFSIIGPVVCSGGSFQQPPLSCTQTGTGRGINGTNHMTVTNGTVRGMGNIGVLASENCVISKVHVISNGATGMSTLNGCVLSENVAMRNGANGIFNQAGTLIGNTAYANGEAGISCTNTCQISKSTVAWNAGAGIAAGGASVVANNSAFSNNGAGISGIGATIIGNTVRSTNGVGIFAQSGLVKDNLSSSNTGVGLQITINTGYSGNVFIDNNGGNANAQVAPGAQSVNLGHNMCGTGLCP